jgi:hypothetical protein
MRSTKVFALALALGVLLGSATSFAQKKPSPAQTVGDSLTGDAKVAYEEARALFKSGDFRGSLDALERAQRISPDPRLFWNMAACEKKLGHYARALGDVDRYLVSGVDVLTADEKREAAQFVAAARAFVGWVTVASNVSGTQVVVDDVLLGTTPLSKPLVVDEGVHKVRFVRPGYRTVERTEQAPAGSDLTWAVVLASETPEPSPRERENEKEKERPAAGKTRSTTGPIVLGAAGLAVAATGAVLVGITLNHASKLEAECGTSCPPSRWETYRTMQTLGDVLLALGGAAVIGAATWWIAPAIGGATAGGRF